MDLTTPQDAAMAKQAAAAAESLREQAKHLVADMRACRTTFQPVDRQRHTAAQRAINDSLERTQESADSETRHSNRVMRPP